MSRATFGTDGWRGIIARDFTFERVREVTHAIIDYLEEEQLAAQGLVVGYDRRFQSPAFAREVAQTAAARGLNVFLAATFLPSPAVSRAVLERQAAAGIIVTASHNPPQYNGLKLKEYFGGSARPSVTARIEELLGRPRQTPGPQLTPGHIELFDGLSGYRRALQEFIDGETLRRAACPLALDVMHGAAAGVLAPLLSHAGFEIHELRGDENPAFEGHAPNPSAEHLERLTRLVHHGPSRLGLATDGDGDRLAAVDETGRYCGPQAIFPLLLHHVVAGRGQRGRVIKSASTTHLIDRICRHYGLPLSETAIGFKHACQAILDDQVLMAGEESGAPGIPQYLPDRDGQLAALLLLECMGFQGLALSELYDSLQTRFGPLHYRQSSLALPDNDGSDLCRGIRHLDPVSLCGLKVRATSHVDGSKWLLDEDSWLLVRASGTEPLIRLYAEAPSAERADELIACGKALIEADLAP